MGIASLVLGIIGIVVLIVSLGTGGLISIVLGVVGVVLGALGRKSSSEGQGVAVAGLVCSIISIAIGVITFATCGCYACQAACALQEIANQLYY